jgi:hypothetical protein
MKTVEEKVTFLERFDQALDQWFSGKQEEAMRKSLNEMVPTAQALVREARCNKTITLTPPPMIGGPIIRNVDLFDMIFENYFGMSLVPSVRDITQQAIGVMRSGRLDEVNKEPEKRRESMLSPPDKVTLVWLVRHVPISLWLIAFGLLASAFALGLKAGAWPWLRDIFPAP